MSRAFDFARLVVLCERTHREMQLHAARTQGLSVVTLSGSEGSKVLASIPSLQYSDQVLAEGFRILRLRLRMTYSNNRNTLARTINRSLVVRNWLFGWYIVEFENGEAELSELYARALIERLSSKLRDNGLKGCSPTNLRKFREFYRVYPEIQQTASVKSIEPPEIQQTPSVDSLPTPRASRPPCLRLLPEDANTYASKYQIYLPSNQELKAQLENIRQEIADREGGRDG